jgi:hypothetical protein
VAAGQSPRHGGKRHALTDQPERCHPGPMLTKTAHVNTNPESTSPLRSVEAELPAFARCATARSRRSFARKAGEGEAESSRCELGYSFPPLGPRPVLRLGACGRGAAVLVRELFAARGAGRFRERRFAATGTSRLPST